MNDREVSHYRSSEDETGFILNPRNARDARILAVDEASKLVFGDGD